MIYRYAITALVENRRKLFSVDATSPSEAIRIFNEKYPDKLFRTFKLMEIIN